MNRFEKELKTLEDGLKKSKTRKDYDSIIERIGKLKQKYGVGSLYNIEVLKEESNTQKSGFKAIKIKFNRNSNSVKKLEKAGNYVLRTNRTDLDNEAISKIHRSLTRIESSFRAMKSDLGLRPNYHQSDKNSIAHIFIVILALHFITATLKKLQLTKISHTVSTLRNILSTHRRTTTIFDTKDNAKEANSGIIEIRNTGTPTAIQREIYRSLKIKQKPLKIIKRRIQLKKSIVS